MSNNYELTEKQKRYLPIKRAVDLMFSSIAIVMFSPVFLVLAVSVKLDSPGPILFYQTRVGRNKKLFEIYKFRTMRTDTPKEMPTHMLLNPDMYITKTGKFLRKTSLDELPQLFNILKGQMSVIGPRPALWNQDDLIAERDKYGVNDVTPGLTGWAQINGRDELDIPLKAKFDGEYVKKMGFSMDVQCFLKTIGYVFHQDGVVEGGTRAGHLKEHKSMTSFLEKMEGENKINKVLGLPLRTDCVEVLDPSNLHIKKEPLNHSESNKKLKILVICQYYYPEPFRISDICEEMVKRGHEVFVLTGVPNYPEGIIYDDYKSGKNRDEIICGVKIHRCFTIGRRTGVLYRLLNYYSYAISSTVNIVTNRYKPENGREYDVVLVNQLSPITMACAGIVYKKLHHKKLVMYCMDLWPESLVAGGIARNSGIYKVFQIISKRIYRCCDKILVTSRMFEDYISDEFDIEKNKIDYLPQYAEELFDSVAVCDAENADVKNGTINFVFAGNIGEIQNVEIIIEAVKVLDSKRLESDKQIIFHIIGGGTDLQRLRTMASEKKLDNIVFHGRKPVTEMPKYYTMADAMMVTLSADPILSRTLPGKVQSYMAAGKPIIGAIKGETKRVISDAKCGFCSEPDNSQELSELILQFTRLGREERMKLGRNAKAYYQKHFARDLFMDRIEGWLRKYI